MIELDKFESWILLLNWYIEEATTWPRMSRFDHRSGYSTTKSRK